MLPAFEAACLIIPVREHRSTEFAYCSAHHDEKGGEASGLTDEMFQRSGEGTVMANAPTNGAALLPRSLLEFGAQVDIAASDAEGLGPVCVTLLFDDDLMIAWDERHCRGCVADEPAIHFDVGTRRSGFDGEVCLDGWDWRGRRRS